MSENKKTVETYTDGFRTNDHAQILSCLTDDIGWEIPGQFHLSGKAAFEQELNNQGFQGNPVITLTRVVEENNIVVTEGVVRSEKEDGKFSILKYCDLFEMHDGKIKKLVSYVMEVAE